jgi:hypothetical protein
VTWTPPTVVCAGFVDIHNHGVGGTDNVTTYWTNPQFTLHECAKRGTTSMLATLVVPAVTTERALGSSQSSASAPASAAPAASGGAGGSGAGGAGGAGAGGGGGGGASTAATPAPPSDSSGCESCVCSVPRAPLSDSDDIVPPQLASVVGVVLDDCAVCEGVHAEGPIIADYGGLPLSETRMPLPRFRALLDRMPGLRVMTISPSVDAADDYARVAELSSRGVVPALGHDKGASQTDILGALRVAGTSAVGTSTADEAPRPHVTHLFNVTTFHHRAAGLTNIGLLPSFPDLPAFYGAVVPTIEIIGDMVCTTPGCVVCCACACVPVCGCVPSVVLTLLWFFCMPSALLLCDGTAAFSGSSRRTLCMSMAHVDRDDAVTIPSCTCLRRPSSSRCPASPTRTSRS